MNFREYTGYFHDGGLIGVVREGSRLELYLRSCEIPPEEHVDARILSVDNALKGKLCLTGVKQVKVDDQKNKEIPWKEYDDGGILDLELSDDTVSLLIEWTNFPPKQRTTEVSAIQIKADKIIWENIPDLSDDYFKGS